MAVSLPDEIVVAITHKKNSPVAFLPTGDILESTFFPYASGPGAPSTLYAFQQEGIPGHRVHVSVSRKVGRISHTLGDPDKRPKLREVQMAARNFQPVGIELDDPAPDLEYKLPKEENIQTWLYHMSCYVQKGNAVLLQGKLEKPEVYLKTGKVLRPAYEYDKHAPKYMVLETEEQQAPVSSGK